MHTQTFNVLQLRGMDERWINEANEASLIVDMTWSGKDAWKDSGGYGQVWRPVPLPEEVDRPSGDQDEEENEASGGKSGTPADPETTAPVPVGSEVTEYDYHYPIHTIHWFSQHNGARQWLLWEQQKTLGKIAPGGSLDLFVFDGTLVHNEDLEDATSTVVPWRQLERWHVSEREVIKQIGDRVPVEVGIKTQTETWGGNLYIVNGYNDPIVFNGEICERAGFNTPPPPPMAKTHQWRHTSTGIVAVGINPNAGIWSKKKSKFTRWMNLFYSGMGPRGYAESGVGAYNWSGSAEKGNDSYKANMAELRVNEQLERRRVGWQYRVTYVNERGQESAPSEPGNLAMFLNGTGEPNQHGKTFVSVDLPIGPAECVARRIYRTRQLYDSDGDLTSKGYGARFYFLAEIQDNMTHLWVDHHPDTHLGSELDEASLGGFPPGTKFLATFKNTMFAAGSMQNTISYSAPLFPEVFPFDNIIHIGDEDGGEITGMRATKNALVVFKTRGIYLVKGNPASGFNAQTLNKDVGCVAPESLAELPGLGLAFLSEKGVMLLEGALENTGSPTRVVDLSVKIPDQVELINKSSAINAVGVVYLKDKEYWLAVPTFGSYKPSRVLIFHYEIGAWSIRENFPIACAVTTRDHRGYLYFGSSENKFSSETTPEKTGLCVYSRGREDKGGTPITPSYETTHIPFGNYFATVQPAHVMVYAVGMGNNDLEVNYEINRSNTFIRSENQSADQQDPNNRFPVYGKAEWGKDYWAIHRPTVIRYDVSTSSKGPVREFKVKISPASRRLEVVGYDIEAKVGEQRKIKPLNEALAPDRR